jgi:hypothetical protein
LHLLYNPNYEFRKPDFKQPVVNALKDKYDYPEWHFIEIANDIRNIKNQLIEKIGSI